MLALAAPQLSQHPSPHEGVFMFGIGNTELLVIAVVALVLFGHRLPSTMFSLGQGFRKLKEGLNTTSSDDSA
jgi:TatA/E family protein of Tat protein translocase